jgi:hypothetical protein
LRGEPNQLKHLQRALVPLSRADPAQPQSEGHVLPHRHVREQRIGLEHHAHIALGGRDVGNVFAADGDVAGVGVLQPCEQAQRGGLAAARRAEQRDELAGMQGQVEPVQRDDGTVVPAQPLHPHLDGGPGRAAQRSGHW